MTQYFAVYIANIATCFLLRHALYIDSHIDSFILIFSLVLLPDVFILAN